MKRNAPESHAADGERETVVSAGQVGSSPPPTVQVYVVSLANVAIFFTACAIRLVPAPTVAPLELSGEKS